MEVHAPSYCTHMESWLTLSITGKFLTRKKKLFRCLIISNKTEWQVLTSLKKKKFCYEMNLTSTLSTITSSMICLRAQFHTILTLLGFKFSTNRTIYGVISYYDIEPHLTWITSNMTNNKSSRFQLLWEKSISTCNYHKKSFPLVFFFIVSLITSVINQSFHHDI